MLGAGGLCVVSATGGLALSSELHSHLTCGETVVICAALP